MTNSADPDQFRSQLIWIYTVYKGRIYPGSAGQGLNRMANSIAVSSGSTLFAKVFVLVVRAERVKLMNTSMLSIARSDVIKLFLFSLLQLFCIRS